MELSRGWAALCPYRKAADVLTEFLPSPSTESFMTLRHRTMKLGERLDAKARDRRLVRAAFTSRPSIVTSSKYRRTSRPRPDP